jgi:ATP-dependent Clp protease ATP-binding subunit ClpA
MLRGLRERFERHHRVEITEDAVVAAVNQSIAASPGRRLPDKAIDLLDEACAMRRLADPTSRAEDYSHAEQQLAEAMERYDLTAVAQLKYRVLPTLRRAARPIVDAVAIAEVK